MFNACKKAPIPTPDSIVREQGLLVQVTDPSLISEAVDIVLQAILQGPGLEQGASPAPVRPGHDHLETYFFKTSNEHDLVSTKKL